MRTRIQYGLSLPWHLALCEALEGTQQGTTFPHCQGGRYDLSLSGLVRQLLSSDYTCMPPSCPFVRLPKAKS